MNEESIQEESRSDDARRQLVADALIAANRGRRAPQAGRTWYCIHPSPIGELLLTSDGVHLTGLYMETHAHWPGKQPDWIWDEAPLCEARRQLGEYFAGTRRDFDLPLAGAGTAFQREVWSALIDIPFGSAISYAELARRIGRPKAMRAVGLANGRNPISIVVPCHRVIGASGALTGYGGGLERKRWLLRHEGVAFRDDAPSSQAALL